MPAVCVARGADLRRARTSGLFLSQAVTATDSESDASAMRAAAGLPQVTVAPASGPATAAVAPARLVRDTGH